MTRREQSSGLIERDVKELLTQGADDLQSRWPNCKIGIAALTPSARSLRTKAGHRQIAVLVTLTLQEGIGDWIEVAD